MDFEIPALDRTHFQAAFENSVIRAQSDARPFRTAEVPEIICADEDSVPMRAGERIDFPLHHRVELFAPPGRDEVPTFGEGTARRVERHGRETTSAIRRVEMAIAVQRAS